MHDKVWQFSSEINLYIVLSVGRIRPVDARVYFRLIRDEQAGPEINGKCKLMSCKCDPDIFPDPVEGKCVV